MAGYKLFITKNLEDNSDVINAAKKISDNVVFFGSSDQVDFDDQSVAVYVLSEFDGQPFESLCLRKARIIGPTALVQLAASQSTLQQLRRPLFCQAFQGVTVCFTGFRDREQLNQLSHYVFYMGGRVRREMEISTTHLIAHHPGGDKFKYADTFGIPVMAASWVHGAWERRHLTGFAATTCAFLSEHKLKLTGLRVCFLGFSNEETQDMNDRLVSNHGIVSHLDDPLLTHLVVDEISAPAIPDHLPSSCHVVKVVWFWSSLQNEICAQVDEYLLKESSHETDRVMHTPGSAASRARKRKRLQQLAARQSASPAERKRRSSVNALDNSGSYLDWTLTPDKEHDGCDSKKDVKPISGRQQKFFELIHTESNYVNILNVIVASFKAPLEQMSEKGNPILDPMDLKMIFGNVPPILETHSSMLAQLKEGEASWSPNFSIGEVILNKAAELQKAYPPFVNYFEQSKEALESCEARNPRFHAFLKIRQSQPECGRQTLKELMIRPVQRLPSISLLLNDLLKHTEKGHTDYSRLEAALAAVKEVMTHINEDKRKTEQRLAMLELCNEIENCPPDLISSHRSLVAKAECTDLSDNRRGDNITFLLFSDTVEICCKRRGKTFATIRGTKPRSLQKLNKTKQFKHLRLLPLNNIKKVYDVRDPDDCESAFALQVYNSDTLQEAQLAFSLCDQSTDKHKFVEILCQQLARVHCTADPDTFLYEMEISELGLDQNKTSSHSLMKFATSAKAKMGRALSLSRTPSRASRIMPRRPAEAPSPAISQLAQMRLQSCANLNELMRESASRTSLLHYL